MCDYKLQSEMSTRLVWATAIILFFLFAEGSEFLPKNCTEEYRSIMTETLTTYSTDRYHSKCGLWGWGRCTRYRRKAVQNTVYVIKHVERKICCNGSLPFNDTWCTTECPEGKYGSDCSMNCSCPSIGKWSSRCDKMTGNCSCENGYQGSSCEDVCPSGFFGEKCAEQCLCHGESSCDHIDGSCNCTSPGWTGEFCENGCSNMTYGYDCKENCNCTVNETCDQVNGKCTCKAGLTGEDCQAVCTDFSFGPDCRQVCECERNHSIGCDPVTGRCMCTPGWEGRICSEVCSLLTYGEDCSKNCTCGSDNFCHHVDGRCFSDLCYGPNTMNCGHQENVDFCQQLDYWYALNDTLSQGKQSIQNKLQNICNTLEKKQTSMICMAESPCNCSIGSQGPFCIKDPVDTDRIMSNNKQNEVAAIAITLTIISVVTVAVVGMYFYRRAQKKETRRKTIVNRTYALDEFHKGEDILPESSGPPTSANPRNDTNKGHQNEEDYDELSRSRKYTKTKGRTLSSIDNTYSHMDNTHANNDGTYSHMSSAQDQSDNTYSHMNTDDADGTYDLTNRDSKMEEPRDNVYSAAVSEKKLSSHYTNYSNIKMPKMDHHSQSKIEEDLYSNMK